MFEFDPEKSNSNKSKHGIDFNEAKKLWNDSSRVIIPAKNIDENRYLLIGKINDIFWSAIFTIRNDNIRIISVRKSRNYEKDIYKSI
jgi:hypothetical protein